MSRIISGVIAIGLMAGLSDSAAAQAPSLGELARQEAARRGTVKKPSRVYTNADVAGDTPRTTAEPAAPAPRAATPSAQPSPAQQEPKKQAAQPPAPDLTKDEKAWRTRIAEAREQLSRNRMFLEALQSRINALTTDFAARDDPAQRGVIAGERQKALSELERVKRDIDRQTAAIAAIQEEARRAGVPPGWVR